MNKLRLNGDQVELHLTGLDMLLTLRRKIEFPISSVSSVSVEPSGRNTPPLLRAPGTYVPRLVTAGTFRGEDRKEFWNVRRAKRQLIINIEGENYTKLVLGLKDPDEKAEMLSSALIHPSS